MATKKTTSKPAAKKTTKAVYEKDIPGVYEILRRGTDEARKVGAQTLAEVRHAMRIDYFDDKELIAEQAKRFAQQ